VGNLAVGNAGRGDWIPAPPEADLWLRGNYVLTVETAVPLGNDGGGFCYAGWGWDFVAFGGAAFDSVGAAADGESVAGVCGVGVGFCDAAAGSGGGT